MLMDVDTIMSIFIKKYIPTVYKYEENDQNSRCPCKRCKNSLISYLSLPVKSFEEDIQAFEDSVDIAGG